MATSVKHLHPFPARMAPEVALEALNDAAPSAVILDPMCGSGTVLHAAATYGHKAHGFDIDPQAVLLARVASSGLSARTFRREADRFISELDETPDVELPEWIASDDNTREFVEFWFEPAQSSELSRLTRLLHPRKGLTADALRVALSRTIITKERGASVARDTSHSRPHRVFVDNTFDVRDGFERAVRHVEQWLASTDIRRRASVKLGDARALPAELGEAIDLVVTSPPYLNAIDYLRGHRLALVWLGHQVSPLRTRRSRSVGAERQLNDPSAEVQSIARAGTDTRELTSRDRGMLFRYASDLRLVTAEIARVLKPGARAISVVGDSTLRGAFIANSKCFSKSAELAGLKLERSTERELPPQHRYLPPPSSENSTLGGRMKTEVVMTFRKPS